MIPPIQYTKCGTVNIAYQVFGTGPVDLVYIPGWVSNIDWMWACPELVHFFEELGKIARIILFDKRGTGLSDRMESYATLEERMEDIKAVMDAANSKRAILFGHSEGGSASALFSATYPNRVLALMAFGIFAKRRYSEDYPWAPTDQERQGVYDMIEHSWGSGQMNLETLAPSKAKDPAFMNWLASYFRSGASPSAAMLLTKMNTQVNITDILSYIKVPTLLMQRTHDIDVKIEEGRFIAERIEDAKFVEFDGEDHLFWAGNTEEVLVEMKDFIGSLSKRNVYKKGLITMLFGHIEKIPHKRYKTDWICALVNAYNGQFIQTNTEYFVATFTSAKNAANCSLQLLEKSKKFGLCSTMGMYAREGNIIDRCQLTTEDIYMIKTIRLQAHLNQILVSQTVKNILSGGNVKFIKTAAILKYQSTKICELFVAESKTEVIQEVPHQQLISDPNDESFLEKLLVVIEQNLDNTHFGIETLCRDLSLSERQLQRKVKEVTGKSPCSLITSMRLKRAKTALLSYKDTVAEVAFQFGFSSPSYFSKCFKKEFGVSPTDMIATP